MARISYDDGTAAAFKAVREISRAGLEEWREAVGRHLRPSPRMTLLDIGAGTGAFSSAFSDWYGLRVVAVEPSAAMRGHIPQTPSIQALAGDACALPLADASADAAWLSLVIHHIPDLELAAREIRRALRPGEPVLIRQAFPDRYEPAGPLRHDGIETWRWFPETARMAATFPSLQSTCAAFAAAGFHREALEQVRDSRSTSLADLLARVDTLRRADTTMRSLSDDEFEQGKERIRRAIRQAVASGAPEPRGNVLDLLVLR
jgi:ubiquinone/menaquinone biosynthesis C-methylase UbiE